MEFKRKKGITELRGIAKSFGISVGTFEKYSSKNKDELGYHSEAFETIR